MRMISRIVLALAVVGLVVSPLGVASTLQASALTIGAPAAHAPDHAGRGVLALLSLFALGGTIQVGDLTKISKKWSQRAANASGDYKDGVAGAGAKYQAGVSGAGDSYRAGVTAAIGRGAYEKGVNGASAKYVDRAVKNGSTRYTGGVQGAEGDWQKGFQPYAAVLNGLDLPAPGPRGAGSNMDRAAKVAIALNKARIGQ